MTRTLTFLEYAYQCDYSKLLKTGDPKRRIRNILEMGPPCEPYYHCFKKDLVGNLQQIPSPGSSRNPDPSPLQACPSASKPTKCTISVFSLNSSSAGSRGKKGRTPSSSRIGGSWTSSGSNVEVLRDGRPSDVTTASAPPLPVYDDSLMVVFTGNLEGRRKEYEKNALPSFRESSTKKEDLKQKLDSTYDFYVVRPEALALDWHCNRHFRPGEKVIRSTGLAKPLKRSDFKKIETKEEKERKQKKKNPSPPSNVRESDPRNCPGNLAFSSEPLPEDDLAFNTLLENLEALGMTVKVFKKADDKRGKQNFHDPATDVYWITRYQSTAS